MCCLQMHTIDTSRQQRRKLPAPPIKGTLVIHYRESVSLYKVQYSVQFSEVGERSSFEMIRESLNVSTLLVAHCTCIT